MPQMSPMNWSIMMTTSWLITLKKNNKLFMHKLSEKKEYFSSLTHQHLN